MARRVVDGGFPLTIWARRPDSVKNFTNTDTSVASSPRQLGAQSEIVGICVGADSDVEEVVLGEVGVLSGMSPGGVIAVHSTVHPDLCTHLSDVASARGVAIIDAPVSGGGGAAAERRLLVMVGGEVSAVERCRPVFETFADPIIHLGPTGSGQMAKLLNNLAFTAQITIAYEMYAFADRLNVDRAALAQVLSSGSGGSRAALIMAASGFDTSGLRNHALPLLTKDLGITIDVATSRNAAPPAHVVELARHTLATLASMAEGLRREEVK